MNEQAQRALHGKIFGTLKTAVLEDGYIDFAHSSQQIDSIAREILKHKAKWLDEVDVYLIVHEFARKKLCEKMGRRANDAEGNLSTFLSEDELREAGQEFVSEIVSIPRKYDAYIQLRDTPDGLVSTNIEETFSIIASRQDDDIPPGIPNIRTLSDDAKLRIPATYLRFTSVGYTTARLENRMVQETINSIKIALHQMLFSRIIKANRRDLAGLAGLLHTHNIQKFSIGFRDQQSGSIESVPLPIDVCRYLERIRFNTQTDLWTGGIRNGNLSALLALTLEPAATLIRNASEEAGGIKAAIEWCFDSLCTENQTIQFLQVCIGLEAIFGGTGSEGITNTLADRCAYLVARNIPERNLIRSKFKELYEIRSKLVHGRTPKLDQNETSHLTWGRDILDLAIHKEMQMMSKRH